MELVRDQWNHELEVQFLSYLETLSNRSKQAWATRMLNTKLDVLVVSTKVLNKIAQDIRTGNYESFLELKVFSNYESTAIYGLIISKVDDFNQLKSYLSVYIHQMDNWAHCDLMAFSSIEDNKDQFIELSNEYLKSDKVFIRRLGLFILYQLMVRELISPSEALNSITSLKDENEHYVIMMAAWLLCESMIRHKEETLAFITAHDINKKIMNKGIQKCRESRRINQKEKDELKDYKK